MWFHALLAGWCGLLLKGMQPRIPPRARTRTLAMGGTIRFEDLRVI